MMNMNPFFGGGSCLRLGNVVFFWFHCQMWKEAYTQKQSHLLPYNMRMQKQVQELSGEGLPAQALY